MTLTGSQAAIVDRFSADYLAMDPAGRSFHFIGAGGVGMSGLVELLLRQGALVSGSDCAPSAVTDRLRRMGAEIEIGHDPRNIPASTAVTVVSAAVAADNPELVAALRAGCRVCKYAEMLGAMSGRYECIAVAGTHGKSTTSGWLVYCLRRAGLDPNFVVGAEIRQLGLSSGASDGKYFVVEACEYDRSFLNLSPSIACILNIEPDHLDYYSGIDQIVEAFGQFALRIRPQGTVIVNGDDANAAGLLGMLPAEIRRATFGLDRGCTFSAADLRCSHGVYRFDVYMHGQFVGRTAVSLPGRHNVLNALAVVAAATAAGAPVEKVLEALAGFDGMNRRLMLRGVFAGVTVLDDYAHHPTEIRASLEAVRQRYRPRKLWCVFQPHQYSRTRFLLDDFAESFKLADVTIVPEIYFVRDSESARRNISSEMLVEKICHNGSRAAFIDGFSGICRYLQLNVAAGDAVVTMGAGDIWKVADEYIQWLGRDS